MHMISRCKRGESCDRSIEHITNSSTLPASPPAYIIHTRRIQHDEELHNIRLLRVYRISEYSAVEQLHTAFCPFLSFIIMIDRYRGDDHSV